MRKLTIIFLTLTLACSLFAGGLVTNTNQGAYYVRTLNRNASTGIDAVYFNPAGLTSLDDGLHAYLSNQSIFQTKTVTNDYQYLKEDEFVGEVTALAFPNIFVAYKMDKLAFSAGFVPIGGGGSAEYDDGLPSFEVQVAGLKEQFGTEYRLDTYFKGSSIYYGGQAGISYQINDMISVSVGGRYVYASNNYEGHLKDIQIQTESGWMSPVTYLTGIAQQFNSAAENLQPVIDGGAGGYTLPELQSAGQLTQEQVEQLRSGLEQAGIDPSGMTAAQIQDAYTNLYNQTAAQIPGLEAATSDKEVDATQTGSGITPIFSVFLEPNADLDIALRYEMKTPLELENDTKTDDTGMFPDGAKSSDDMPAMLAVGVAWQMSPKLKLETNINYYFAEDVDWDGAEEHLNNEYEAGLAVEYALTDAICASGGYLFSTTSATEKYQTDLSYGLDSHTVGVGIGYKLLENLRIDVGALNTFYMEGEDDTGREHYQKTTMDFAVGVGYSF